MMRDFERHIQREQYGKDWIRGLSGASISSKSRQQQQTLIWLPLYAFRHPVGIDTGLRAASFDLSAG
jgi:hypothetical protein